MEVILKKTKITSKILDQVLTISPLQEKSGFELLGWCIHNHSRYAVYYSNKSNDLRKVNIFNQHNSSREYQETLNSIITKAEQKGQFFI